LRLVRTPRAGDVRHRFERAGFKGALGLPERVQRVLAGRRVVRDGQTLATDIQAWLACDDPPATKPQPWLYSRSDSDACLEALASGVLGKVKIMQVTSVSEPHHVDRHVGALIRAKRKAMGMSQTELAEAMALMVDGHFRHLPVVNDEGHVIGLASMRDLMAYTSLRLRHGSMGTDDDLDPAEVIATIHRMRTGAA
jgi:hypothetical protein